MLINIYYKNVYSVWMAKNFNEKEIKEIINIVKKYTKYSFFYSKAKGFICKNKKEFEIVYEIIKNYSNSLTQTGH